MTRSISASRRPVSETSAGSGRDQEIEIYALFLDSGAEQSLIAEAFDTANSDAIANALGVVARARGISGVARQAGVARETLYRALREGGDPKLSTFIRVIDAIGMKISVQEK
ncbi:addiction module antidote protein [Pseudochelatococcus contaminans]|uniref:Putative addiction module antidote protein n=1 Tax=Pseudochelatococcus contaminans TaxID=1538103 RepID=A0A7W5Z726_9HYPH|nr:addiction module antidote protein [Pseudochelatococcus contaminans]MBB3811373.1 putative addiction module antidote protein [Pseudochelatococcus contaminans]